MKILLPAILFLLCMLAGTVSATAGNFAYTVSPEGNFVQGSPVNVSFTVNFTERFVYTHELEFSTQLDNPVWNYTIFLNGVPEPRPIEKKNFSISGFELDYPTRKVLVTGTLGGTAPAVSKTTETSVLSVNEFDTRNNVTITSPFTVERYNLPDQSLLPGPAIPTMTASQGSGTVFDRLIGWFRSLFNLS